jgi:hypothetical protein
MLYTGANAIKQCTITEDNNRQNHEAAWNAATVLDQIKECIITLD